MKPLIIIGLVFSFIACTEPKSKSIYDAYLPGELKSFLRDSLPGWNLPDPNRWDSVAFHLYKTPKALVSYISGDFNCDKKTDYALLLGNKNDSLAVWVVQSAGKGFKATSLIDLEKQPEHIQYGLFLVQPGNLEYIDPESDAELKPMVLKCNAIQVEYFESGAVTYYWKNGKYQSVITGD